MSDSDRIAAIERQLQDGKERMDAMQIELSANTTITREIREILDVGRSGLKVLGGLAAVARWVGALAVAIGSVWGLIYGARHGVPPGK